MNKKHSNRVTRLQFEKMADFLEKYPQMISGTIGYDFHKSFKDELWRDLADILNEAGGPKKSVFKWRKCFKDYKCYMKKKYLTYLADTSTLSPLSYLDVRYLAMMGYVVDVQGMNYSNSDLQTIMLEEINRDVVSDIIYSPEYEEENIKNCHAPEIITLLPRDDNCAPKGDSENVSNTENSENIEDTSKIKESLYNKETTGKVSSDNKVTTDNEELPYNEETPLIEESSCNEESPCNEKAPSKISKNKKQGKKSKNMTAVALQAIAKELNVKNELTKMKIELEKEKLLLEKRKIAAFELIAKRLRRE